MRLPRYLPDVKPLTVYRVISGLGGLALLIAGLANPSDGVLVAVTRYIAIAAMLGLSIATLTSVWARQHVGWLAYLVGTSVVVYLCSMLYNTGLDAESLIASFVGVLICGMALHRVPLVDRKSVV